MAAKALNNYPGLFQAHVREARDEINKQGRCNSQVGNTGLIPFADYANTQRGELGKLALRISKMGEGAKYQLFHMLAKEQAKNGGKC